MGAVGEGWARGGLEGCERVGGAVGGADADSDVDDSDVDSDVDDSDTDSDVDDSQADSNVAISVANHASETHCPAATYTVPMAAWSPCQCDH